MRHADGPPLIALLQRRFGANKKNMLYMGSTAYMIFGIESRGINPTEVHTVQYPHDGIQVRPDQITRVREKYHSTPGSSKVIDDGKYWRR